MIVGPALTTDTRRVQAAPASRRVAAGQSDPRSIGQPTAAPARLAVIIPCFNYERYVGRAIESVMLQGRDDVDLLVVDDGSTDASWQVIQDYGLAKAYRIPNGGPLKACLAAARHTDAEFILVLDADDELKPGSLNRILPLLTPDVAKLQFTLALVDADGRVLGAPAPQLQDFRERDSLIEEIRATGSLTSPPTSGNVFRRDVFELLQDVDYDCYIDGVTLFAAPFFGEVVSLSDQLGCYRLHGANASGIGVKPDAAKIRSEIERFVARLDHLRRILDDRGAVHAIPPATETFFHRERSLYLTLAQGRRPSASHVLGALASLRRQPMTIARKAALAGLALASLALPPSRAVPLLAYRMSPGRRSASGFIRTFVVAP
jgi:glycosyltransferase involved in cell wall biosynthesis